MRDKVATRQGTKHSKDAHQPSSPLKAASSNLKGNYDVFLSFRGTDVRNNFLSHLYAALDQKEIYTYVDSKELPKGEQITPAIIKAIEDSHIAIIIFSEDYASSPWCLEEVEKIMECKEQRGLIVFPVFYKVEPKEVRTPRGSYREAMVKHESKLGRDSEKVKRWEKALYDAGSLSGWDLNDKDEADSIKSIVQEISMHLDRMPLFVAKHPIGICLRVAILESMLNLESRDDVLMIGLWGQGGIGKTTLAKALYNDIFRQFEASCFLANVRETSKDSKDLAHLQEELLSEIFLGKGLTVFSVDGGINLIQDRLCRKKVLLVLDDINDVKQLNVLAGERGWFGKGSRIVITTRDNHLLTCHGIDKDHIYEVKTLEDWEALQLFDKHAFLRSKEIVIRRDLVDSALHYAKGLPLALEVLGCFLCGRKEQEWESALNKLAKRPDKTINNVLKLSYDGLEDYAKEVFLDIACFFKGQSVEYIMNVLNSCDFDTTIGVQVLVEKSLITKDWKTIHMHDLIQLMGMDIVKQECRDDPGRRSRLWLWEDIRYVLSEDIGTNNVKAIVLILPKAEATYIGPNAFTNMRRLRLLIMINVHNSFQGPVYLPNELRWFEWPERPSWVIEFPFGPEKLVGLDMRKSNIQVMVDQFKDFKNLKFLNFSECPLVVCMPNLDLTPNLEELDLHGCKNWSLRLLNLKGCSRLNHLLDVLQSKNLQVLILTGCSKLQRFPDIPDKIKGLEELYLRGTSIKELPASIENLVSLEKLNLIDCKKLANLPSSIYKLSNLEILLLDGCSKLIKFPKKEEDSSDLHSKTGFPKLVILQLEGCNLLEGEFLKNHSCFPRLRDLSLSIHNFAELPTCGHLHKLHDLRVSECRQLQEIGKIPGQLQRLSAMNCESLSKIPSNMWAVNHIDKLLLNKQIHPEVQCNILLPGGEMPQWLLPNKEGYISFTTSKDLYKKFLALAICVVYRVKEGRQNVQYCLRQYVNGKFKCRTRYNLPLVHLDHVWLNYLGRENVGAEDDFGPNDWSSFQLGISVLGGAMVKKCGVRLICKSLEDDLEALYQEEKLLDPGLIYEIWHDDKETITREESYPRPVYKLSLPLSPFPFRDCGVCSWRYSKDDISPEEVRVWNGIFDIEDDELPLWVDEGCIDLMPSFPRNDIMADFSVERFRYPIIPAFYRDILPGGDMPEEFILVEGSTISFMVSRDFYDKFLGLALCVVFNVDNGEKEIFFDIMPHVNGQRRNGLSGSLGSFDSDHMWIQYLKPNVLWGVLGGVVDFLEFDKDCLQFSLTLSVLGGTMKKFGYVLRCKQMDDDLKVVLIDNQLVDPASIYEMKFEEFLYKFLPRQMEEWKRLRVELERQMEIITASDSSGNETN
ncbi:hypothetical protein ACJRO7_030987 [Eucalyptus globulus]|uniref:TIR domain-containing protein n=1 Tax=Eucalyptus globulus TaxID=34317 RepID=A0ABD3JR75_EUCGL